MYVGGSQALENGARKQENQGRDEFLRRVEGTLRFFHASRLALVGVQNLVSVTTKHQMKICEVEIHVVPHFTFFAVPVESSAAISVSLSFAARDRCAAVQNREGLAVI